MMSYQRAGVASTFSPTFAAVLAEAERFAAHCGAALEIVHAAAYDAEKEQRFHEAIGRKAEIRWVEDETPAKAILGAARNFGYELLIAGALQSETDDTLFTSGVARGLLRGATCDLLLVPRPQQGPVALRRLVFTLDPGEGSAEFLQRVAHVLQPEHITIAVNKTPFAAAIAASRGEEPRDEDAWLDELIAGFADGKIEVETRVVTSNTGYSLCEAIQGIVADLLIVKAEADGTLPVHMNWLYQVIPSRLLVVR
jgi:nucleotide-binding universal stress UspA family protein